MAAWLSVLDRQQVKSGLITTVTHGNITITFPSAKFCKNWVDDEFLDHIHTNICGQNKYFKGNGEVEIGHHARCGHVKMRGGNAIGWDWGAPPSEDTIFIGGYGEKGGKGAKRQNSGGYTWES